MVVGDDGKRRSRLPPRPWVGFDLGPRDEVGSYLSRRRGESICSTLNA